MNIQKIKGDWNQAAGKLKQKYANLTDNDLIFQEGKGRRTLGKIAG